MFRGILSPLRLPVSPLRHEGAGGRHVTGFAWAGPWVRAPFIFPGHGASTTGWGDPHARSRKTDPHLHRGAEASTPPSQNTIGWGDPYAQSWKTDPHLHRGVEASTPPSQNTPGGVTLTPRAGKQTPISTVAWRPLTHSLPVPAPYIKVGGAGRIRTADKGFADLCLTTWPRRRMLPLSTVQTGGRCTRQHRAPSL